MTRFSSKSTAHAHGAHSVVGLSCLCVSNSVFSEDVFVCTVNYLSCVLDTYIPLLLHTCYFVSYGLWGCNVFFSVPVRPQYYLLLVSVVQYVLSWLVLRVREWRAVVKNAREDVLL